MHHRIVGQTERIGPGPCPVKPFLRIAPPIGENRTQGLDSTFPPAGSHVERHSPGPAKTGAKDSRETRCSCSGPRESPRRHRRCRSPCVFSPGPVWWCRRPSLWCGMGWHDDPSELVIAQIGPTHASACRQPQNGLNGPIALSSAEATRHECTGASRRAGIRVRAHACGQFRIEARAGRTHRPSTTGWRRRNPCPLYPWS